MPDIRRLTSLVWRSRAHNTVFTWSLVNGVECGGKAGGSLGSGWALGAVRLLMRAVRDIAGSNEIGCECNSFLNIQLSDETVRMLSSGCRVV